MGQSYRDLLSDAWDELPPGVRLALSPPIQAEGKLTIKAPQLGFARLMARAIKLPAAGENVQSTLDVTDEHDGVRCVRQFGEMRAVSVQYIGTNAVQEVAPPFLLEFKMIANGSVVEVVQTRLKLFGISMPIFCGPQVRGSIAAGPDDQSWNVSVSIDHVWLGMISAYEGVMRVR